MRLRISSFSAPNKAHRQIVQLQVAEAGVEPYRSLIFQFFATNQVVRQDEARRVRVSDDAHLRRAVDPQRRIKASGAATDSDSAGVRPFRINSHLINTVRRAELLDSHFPRGFRARADHFPSGVSRLL